MYHPGLRLVKLCCKDVSCSRSGSYRRSVVPRFTIRCKIHEQFFISIVGLGLPLSRYILQNTSLSVVALTSRRSNRVKDDILSKVDGGSQPALHDRLRVIEGVDLLDERSIERAAKEAEVGKSVRLVTCFAGEVRHTCGSCHAFVARGTSPGQLTICLATRSYTQKSRLRRWTCQEHCTRFSSTQSDISCFTSTSYH